jgi:hypothetical protein
MAVIRLFLLGEAAAFCAAALIHGGYLVPGYAHRSARIAESVIGLVLALAWAFTLARPAAARTVGLYAQGFALAGTLVGAFTIAIGVGPRTAPDVIYHALLLAILVTGLVVTARARPLGARP